MTAVSRENVYLGNADASVLRKVPATQRKTVSDLPATTPAPNTLALSTANAMSRFLSFLSVPEKRVLDAAYSPPHRAKPSSMLPHVCPIAHSWLLNPLVLFILCLNCQLFRGKCFLYWYTRTLSMWKPQMQCTKGHYPSQVDVHFSSDALEQLICYFFPWFRKSYRYLFYKSCYLRSCLRLHCHAF